MTRGSRAATYADDEDEEALADRVAPEVVVLVDGLRFLELLGPIIVDGRGNCTARRALARRVWARW